MKELIVAASIENLGQVIGFVNTEVASCRDGTMYGVQR